MTMTTDEFGFAEDILGVLLGPSTVAMPALAFDDAFGAVGLAYDSDLNSLPSPYSPPPPHPSETSSPSTLPSSCAAGEPT